MPKKRIEIAVIPLDKIYEKNRDLELYSRFIKSTSPTVSLSKTRAHHEKRASLLWIDEAVTYLGLDRCGLKQPKKAIHRLVKKGALHPKKISGRLSFDIAELELVVAKGDHKRGRGRPRQPRSA